MAKRKTHEEFVKEISVKHPNIKILTEYKNAKSKIKCECLIDGCVWEVSPTNLLNSEFGCPKCVKNIKNKQQSKSHDTFINELKSKNNSIIILSNYINSNTKIKCKCNICNNEWEATPNSLLNGCGCPKCAIKNKSNRQRKTKEQFVKEMKIINSNIKIIGEYINNNTKIECKCLICRNIFFMTPKNLKKGQNCPKCAMKQRILKKSKTHEQFIDELKNINKNIKVLNKYINAKTIIKCSCNICGCEWESNADNLLRGHGCPKCAIENISGENNYNWNPNLTQEDREDKRNYQEYREWRTKCFERDNYTCQITGKRGVELCVHHLYSYDKYRCLRTVMENGITVSKEMHELFHKKYGRGNNTLEQWEEFIKSLK